MPSERMFSNLIARGISTSSLRHEMMNITKMETFNKRGTKKFKKEQYRKWQKKGGEGSTHGIMEYNLHVLNTSSPTEQCSFNGYLGAHPDLKVHTYGSRTTGVRHEAYWQEVPG